MLFLIICLIAAGTVAGGVTMNPIILGIIPGYGLILITYCVTKDFKKKNRIMSACFYYLWKDTLN